ncbi:MAG: prolipoprotein diacylglyceryl transferase [Actinomycetota bacterium]|nr:prolipoprotein diacylglyceryl transferase [Actinomycetota bacterium]
MYPILLRLGPLVVYSYGFMLAVAFLIGALLARREAKRKGFDPDIIYDLVIWVAIGGIVGARLFYVIGHWESFAVMPLSIFAIWEGGLVYYGGLAGGALAVVILVLKRGLPIWDTADMITLSLALGYAIARIGCFLNGCCHGRPSNLPWAVVFPDVDVLPRHPTQLYSFLYGVFIFGILWVLRERLNWPGLLFWFYLTLYSVARFVIEFFRESPIMLGGLTIFQIISVGVFLVAAIAIMIMARSSTVGANESKR